MTYTTYAKTMDEKHLEWRPGSVAGRYVADVFGKPMYEVGFDHKWYWAHGWLGVAVEYVEGEAAAKAAAQADYEQRTAPSADGKHRNPS